MTIKSIIGVFLLLLLMLGLGRNHLWDAANKSAGYLNARYDIYTNHPKFYIYGYVRVYEVQEKYKKLGVEPIFRGCLVGDDRYVRESSYNNEISHFKPKLKFPS